MGFDILVEFQAQVSDPDPESSALIYTWNFEQNIGKLSGDTGLIFWTVLKNSIEFDTDVTITVTVTDGSSNASEAKVVSVIISQTPDSPAIVLGCTDNTSYLLKKSTTSLAT